MLGRIVGVRLELGPPILGQTKAFGDGSKAEKTKGKIDGLAEFAKLAEGFVGLLRFAGSVEKGKRLGPRARRTEEVWPPDRLLFWQLSLLLASGKIGLGPADFVHALGGRDGFLGFFLFPLGKELVNLEFGEGVLGKGDTLLFVSLLFLAFIGFLLDGRHFLGVGLFLLFARSVRFLCLGDRGVLIIWLCLGVFGLLLDATSVFSGLGGSLLRAWGEGGR